MEELQIIKKRIADLGQLKKFVAGKIGVNPVTFSYYLNNKKKLSESKVQELKDYLGL
tara:strand:- start:309 stop:479 length:171 start_codon:yes stop_codon:yes gene_type:complete